MNKDKSTVLATLTLASTGQLKSWQIRTAKQLMLDRLDTGISVTELAEACALSRSHFSRMFKQSTRMAPQRWLREQRVMKSRELLNASTMLLTEIALECGFSDQSHFCRTFVKAEGMTPKAWQQQAICPIPVVA
ncbi:MAG: helix-turn-helix domain-containing protein [Pseudomonas sp.]|uniref:helix-turn-helix domain-containing protein n=1 Tax=Pseudomonas sp. TaxID=306 RepID=UPI003D6FBB44